MNLLIIGAGGHGHVVKETAKATKQFNRIAFIDDNSPIAIGKCDDYLKLSNEYNTIFVAIGDNEMRKLWLEKVQESSFIIPTIIHPLAHVSPSAKIADGVIAFPFSVIHTNAEIQRGCIIGAGSVVDHDSVLGECSHINSGAIVSSHQTIPPLTKVEKVT